MKFALIAAFALAASPAAFAKVKRHCINATDRRSPTPRRRSSARRLTASGGRSSPPTWPSSPWSRLNPPSKGSGFAGEPTSSGDACARKPGNPSPRHEVAGHLDQCDRLLRVRRSGQSHHPGAVRCPAREPTRWSRPGSARQRRPHLLKVRSAGVVWRPDAAGNPCAM